MPTRNALIIGIASILSVVCYEKATHNRYARLLAHAMQVVEDNYVEEVDAPQLFENAMTGMVGQLDQYSSYIPPKQLQLFQQNLDQEFVGIGIVVEGPPQTDHLTVVSPVYGSPAYDAGLRAGDVILEIDGQSAKAWTLEEAVERIKGPRGTTVTLVTRHAESDESRTTVVQRDLIHTKSVLGDTRANGGSWNYFLQDDPRIGYVRLTTFGERTAEELQEVLAFSQHPVEGLILDLRGNAGGLLSAAVSICDMFIETGTIVSIRGRRKKDQEVYTASPSNTVFDSSIPMVVLVDRYSASASEIVAACLKDHGRAAIVGHRTWGKGTVQNIIMMEQRTSAIKLTTASYWRPSGKNIHRRRNATEQDDWGVRPSKELDVELTPEQYREVFKQRRERDVLHTPDDAGQEAIPAINDPQRNRAVEYLQSRIEPAPPKPDRSEKA